MVLGNDFQHPFVDDRVYREAQALIMEGWSVSVVCWARTITNKSLNHLPPVSSYDGIRIYRIFQNISPTSSSLIKRIGQHIKAMKKMAKKIEETKPDIIHYNDFNTLYSIKFGGRSGSTKVIYDSHEDYSLMIRSAVPTILEKIASRLERRTVRKHVNAVLTVSQPILDRLSKLGADKNELVMNCKELEKYDLPKETVMETRKRISKSHIENPVIMLYIGSLGEDRGVRELIEVFKSLNNNDNIYLIIGGHGEIEVEISEEMKKIDNTVFLGEVANEDVPLYTKACDVVVMMMNPEVEWHRIAMPNKLFEAMAAGVPIIASESTTYGDVVKKENCGVVIPYGELGLLKKTIMELADNPTLREQLGRNGFNAAKREYNWERQKEKLIAVYNDLLDNR